LELALESLQNKKKQIDAEIAEIYRELRGRGSQKGLNQTRSAGTKVAASRKPAQFSKEERLRRSQRMKAYWENWRKKKSRGK
jgi:uncharacterized protein (UPF0335 family)